MKAGMKMHLDLTVQEAVDRLSGNVADDIKDYDKIHEHILGLADLLSSGILAQFPDRLEEGRPQVQVEDGIPGHEFGRGGDIGVRLVLRLGALEDETAHQGEPGAGPVLGNEFRPDPVRVLRVALEGPGRVRDPPGGPRVPVGRARQARTGQGPAPPPCRNTASKRSPWT